MSPFLDFPLLTRSLPGTGGELKVRAEDFVVDEVPLYDPCGKGDHAYCRIEKRLVTSMVAAKRIAQFAGIHPKDVGIAGMKDSTGVTTQWLSLEHVDPDRLASFRDSQIRVLEVNRHTNKLRTGHLRGNRFQIRVRNCVPEAEQKAQAVLSELERKGIPNYFGTQRFGSRGDNAQVGGLLMAGDAEGFLNHFLGQPLETDPPDCRGARSAFDAGEFEKALTLWPRHYDTERRVLVSYAKGRNPVRAVRSLDKRMAKLYVSAWQSQIFNEIVAARIDALHQVQQGDLAQKTDSGGVFLVEDPRVEQPRADAFEISPTGPLAGGRCRLAEGTPGELERSILATNGLNIDEPRGESFFEPPGGRRALRFRVEDIDLQSGTDAHGPFLQVSFFAPSGAYATVVLQEIMKGQ